MRTPHNHPDTSHVIPDTFARLREHCGIFQSYQNNKPPHRKRPVRGLLELA